MKKLILALAISAGCFGQLSVAIAAPVVVTPGSMAGYTYFPPATTGSGSGGSGTDNVGTLQRCFWTPPAGDHTVNLANSNWYDYGDTRPLTLYYMVAGGNGGNNPGGGGGGSSAILKNGSLAALGPGGDGGMTSTATEGTVQLIKTDVLRFITGGGGGPGATNYSGWGAGSYWLLSGGGGGAGYTGGGGGGSSQSSITAAQLGTLWGNTGGKGGRATPGAGGVSDSPSNIPGTSGSGMNGGIGVYPDGNSAAVGAVLTNPAGTYYITCDGTCYGQWKHRATPTIGGSHGFPVIQHSGSMRGTTSGGGGALGIGGSPSAGLVYDAFVPSGTVSTSPNTPSAAGNGSGSFFTGVRMSSYTPPTSLALTRPAGLSVPGQIVVMYQAPVCSILR